MSVNVHLGDEQGLDRSRRYLRPVNGYEPNRTHSSVYQWIPSFEAWATGMAICGLSTEQGPLPEGTAVTCTGCQERREDYERYLAPGYRPEDDDPKALRKRAEAAEIQVKQARALVARWREIAAGQEDAMVRVDVAAGILTATLDGFNDLLAEVEGQ